VRLPAHHSALPTTPPDERAAAAEKFAAPSAPTGPRTSPPEAAAPRRRAAISLFLAFQYVRGPGTRRALVERHEVMAKAVVVFATPEAARKAAAERGVEITDKNLAAQAKLEQLGDREVMVERSAVQHVDMPVKQGRAP
jgi:hypothetical protein